MMNNWKIKLIKGLFLGVCLLTSSLSSAAGMCSRTSEFHANNGGLPWPWALALEISLRDVEGTWATPDGECKDLFSFKVTTDQAGDQIVAITQYNPSTCRAIATGVGYQNGKSIFGQLSSGSGKAYDITIRAFSEDDVERAAEARIRRGTGGPSGVGGNVVMAMSLFPVGQSDEQSADLISRVDASTNSACQF